MIDVIRNEIDGRPVFLLVSIKCQLQPTSRQIRLCLQDKEFISAAGAKLTELVCSGAVRLCSSHLMDNEVSRRALTFSSLSLLMKKDESLILSSSVMRLHSSFFFSSSSPVQLVHSTNRWSR